MSVDERYPSCIKPIGAVQPSYANGLSFWHWPKGQR